MVIGVIMVGGVRMVLALFILLICSTLIYQIREIIYQIGEVIY